VQAKLKKRAAAVEQVADIYVVKVGVRTNTLRDLIDTWQLDITDEAAAP
jgi:hypothetical protein